MEKYENLDIVDLLRVLNSLDEQEAHHKAEIKRIVQKRNEVKEYLQNLQKKRVPVVN